MTTQPAPPAASTQAAPDHVSSPASHLLTGLLGDVGPSVAAYYGLRAFGADTWVSMLGATVVAGVQTVVSAVRGGKLNAFSALLLVVFGLGFALTFVTGDPRLGILKDSAITAGVGLLFLVSTAIGRPLTLEASKKWAGDGGVAIQARYDGDAAVRQGYRLTSVVWGAAMVAEAALRVVLTFTLSVDVMEGLSTVMWVVLVVGLLWWTNWAAARRQKAAAGGTAAAPAAG